MSVFDSLLNNDFTRLRMRRTTDGQGGWVSDYPEDTAVTIRGRIRPASSSEMEIALREERLLTHVFYCVAGVDVRRGDQLHVTSPGSGHVLIVEVDAIREPSLAGKHWECDCRELQVEVSAEESGS